MQEIKPVSRTEPSRAPGWIQYGLPVLILVALGVALLAFRATGERRPSAAIPGTEQITESELEARFGLRVNLVAVTAAGGLVDLRLKIVDGAKAKSLLQDPDNFPALRIADGDVTLVIPEENRSQEIKFEDDANLFMTYPNAGNIVKPGTPVTIVFGALKVDPILAR